MSNAARQAISATVALLCTAASIALLYAAHFPFPPALEVWAVPQWLVFAAVVSSANQLGFYVVGRVVPELMKAPVRSEGGAA
jgi:hypothetical protein